MLIGYLPHPWVGLRKEASRKRARDSITPSYPGIHFRAGYHRAKILRTPQKRDLIARFPSRMMIGRRISITKPLGVTLLIRMLPKPPETPVETGLKILETLTTKPLERNRSMRQVC